jgi:hypothetical protein
MSRRKFIAPGAAYADRMDPADIIRFMKFIKVDEHGCWIWTGTTDDKGYGGFKVHGRSRWAHPQHLAQRSRDWNSLDGGRRRAQQVACEVPF